MVHQLRSTLNLVQQQCNMKSFVKEIAAADFFLNEWDVEDYETKEIIRPKESVLDQEKLYLDDR